jgi:hypothetical protein
MFCAFEGHARLIKHREMFRRGTHGCLRGNTSALSGSSGSDVGSRVIYGFVRSAAGQSHHKKAATIAIYGWSSCGMSM